MSNKHEIIKEISGKIWEEALTKSFNENVKDAKIDGFRKGKCPRDIYEKKYGIESLYSKAVDHVLPTVYSEILKENNLEPVVEPSIDVEEISKDKVVFKFIVITRPTVNIKKYKGLKVKKEKVVVTKEEINNEIDRLRNQFAEIEIKDDKIENGDTAIIDFEGFKDDVAFEGGKGENYPLEIGSHTFIPGFEEQLVGLKTGDDKDVKVTFPEDYPSEELKGKEVVFKVKIHEVKTRVLPELNEDFFNDLGVENVNSEKELEEYASSLIKNRKELELENKLIDEILEKVSKETEIELPEELVHEEVHRMMDSYNQKLQMQGLSLEQYMQFTNKTMEDLENELKDEASKNITYRYMLEHIAEKENLEISEEEIKEETTRLAQMYQMSEEELIGAFGGVEMVKYDLKMRKAIEFLKENN